MRRDTQGSIGIAMYSRLAFFACFPPFAAGARTHLSRNNPRLASYEARFDHEAGLDALSKSTFGADAPLGPPAEARAWPRSGSPTELCADEGKSQVTGTNRSEAGYVGT